MSFSSEQSVGEGSYCTLKNSSNGSSPLKLYGDVDVDGDGDGRTSSALSMESKRHPITFYSSLSPSTSVEAMGMMGCS